MKKSLLLVAVMAGTAFSSLNAQKVGPEMRIVTQPQVKEISLSQLERVNAQTKDDFYSPVVKSFKDSLWYGRPAGVLAAALGGYLEIENSGWRVPTAPVMSLPVFTPVTFVNKSQDKATTEWSMWASFKSTSTGRHSLPLKSVQVTDDNDITVVAEGGREYWEIPVLKRGTSQYFWGDQGPNIATYPSYLVTDTLYDLGFEEFPYGLDVLQSMGNSYIVGTKSDRIDFNQDGKNETVYLDGFHEFCPKPIAPLAVNRIDIPITTMGGSFFEGFGSLTFTIYKVKYTPSGTKTLGDVIFTTEVNDDNFAQAPGVLVVGKQAHLLIYLTDDEKGYLTLDDEFAIELKGFQQDGVDVGTRVIQRLDVARHCLDSSPVLYTDYVNKAGEYVGSSIYSNNQLGVPVSFYCFYDVMKVDAEKNKIEVEADGTCTAKATTYTQLSWFNKGGVNYELAELPEWVKSVKATPIAKSVHELEVVCEALPAGVTSRSCEVKIKSVAGNLSDDVITITQSAGDSPAVKGDVNGDGKVDVADVNIIIDIILENATKDQYPAADVTGDGKVDVADVNAVIDIILNS